MPEGDNKDDKGKSGEGAGGAGTPDPSKAVLRTPEELQKDNEEAMALGLKGKSWEIFHSLREETKSHRMRADRAELEVDVKANKIKNDLTKKHAIDVALIRGAYEFKLPDMDMLSLMNDEERGLIKFENGTVTGVKEAFEKFKIRKPAVFTGGEFKPPAAPFNGAPGGATPPPLTGVGRKFTLSEIKRMRLDEYTKLLPEIRYAQQNGLIVEG